MLAEKFRKPYERNSKAVFPGFVSGWSYERRLPLLKVRLPLAHAFFDFFSNLIPLPKTRMIEYCMRAAVYGSEKLRGTSP